MTFPPFSSEFPLQHPFPANPFTQPDNSCNCVRARKLQHLLQLNPELEQLLDQAFPTQAPPPLPYPGSFPGRPQAASTDHQQQMPPFISTPDFRPVFLNDFLEKLQAPLQHPDPAPFPGLPPATPNQLQLQMPPPFPNPALFPAPVNQWLQPQHTGLLQPAPLPSFSCAVERDKARTSKVMTANVSIVF